MANTIVSRLQAAVTAFRQPQIEQKSFPLPWFNIRRQRWEWQIIDYETYAKEGYSQNEIVHSAIRYKADSFALVPLAAWEGDKNKPAKADTNHPLSRFAERPNTFQSMYELMQQSVVYLDLSGNLFWYFIGLNDGQDLQMFTLRPDRVFIVPRTGDDAGTVAYVYLPDGASLADAIPILPENMIHIRYPNPLDPLEGQGYGLSPLSAAAHSVDIDNLMTEFLFGFFKSKGVMPGGVIEIPHEIDNDDILKLREQFTSEYGGSDEWGKPLVIDNGAVWKQQQIGFADMGLDIIDKRNTIRSTAIFGVDAKLLGLNDASETFSNRQEAEKAFWTHTMFSLLTMFQTELQFRLHFNDGVFLGYDFSGIPAFQADRAEQATIYTSLVEMFVPPNIAIEVSGLDIPPLPDGDISYMPIGLIPVSDRLSLTAGNGASADSPVSENEVAPSSDTDMEDLQEQEIDEAASLHPVYIAVKEAQSEWDYEAKQRIGKQLDDIAQDNEHHFEQVSRQEFNRERRAILAIIGEGKSRGLLDKATVNFDNITQKINRYMTLTSPREWREAVRPAVLAIATDTRVQWINELNLSDEFATFTLRNIESEVWFDEYVLRFSRDVTTTTSADIHNIIAQSLTDGEGVDTISNRIGNMFDQYITGNTSPDDWAFLNERQPIHRLEMIARTETHAAAQAGSHNLFSQANVKLKEWLATGDTRTRETHLAAWAQYSRRPIPIDDLFQVGVSLLLHPGDKNGSPEETINCFIPDTKVEGSFVAGSKVWYSGPVWELETLRGHTLTVTAYHPILTNRGWIAANELIEGDYLLTRRNEFQSGMQRNINHQNSPTRIEDVFNSLRSNSRMFSPVATALDFDGDGRFCEGEIDIVYMNGILPSNINTQGSFQRTLQFQLIFSRDFGSVFVDANSTPDLAFYGVGVTAPSIPSGTHLAINSFRVGLDKLPFKSLRFGTAAEWDTVLGQKSRYDSSTVSEFFTELIDASAGQVAPDKLIKITQCDFEGHVYDLQAIDGWILSENIVSGNCRCVELPVINELRPVQ